MSANPTQINSLIQNTRDALRRGDQSEARRWAEQAVRIAPELEDAWLLMAAASGHATACNMPNVRRRSIRSLSGRARPWSGRAIVLGRKCRPRARQTQVEPEAETAKAPKRRSPLYFILLAGLACVVVAFAAWSVSKSSALASIVKNVNEPAATSTPETNFAVAELDKPTYTPEWTFTPSFTPTPKFTNTPSITPTPEFTSTPLPTNTPLPTDTPGVIEAAIVADTPTPILPTAAPYAAPTQQAYVPPSSSGGGGAHWIDIDLTNQRLYAYEGDTIVQTFIVSTGVWGTPTVTGKYKIYARYLYADMHGPGYFLPDVPYTMYFHKSYGIHGTYWHNNFGTPMSHGCVNMSIPDAEWLYYWSTFGTVVNVHY